MLMSNPLFTTIISFLVVFALMILFRKHFTPKPDAKTLYLKKHGIKARGKVLKVVETGKKLNHIYPMALITVEITPPNTAPFIATIEAPVSYRSFPSLGTPVQVLFNPKNPQEFIFG